MIVTHIELTNWRNFREMDLNFDTRAYIIGANASGKSNLLDVFRFLRTVAKPTGGGLQAALRERGGMGKLRSLHARSNPAVAIVVELAESLDPEAKRWIYELAFKSGKGKQRVLITRERVVCDGTELFSRPNKADEIDDERLTQTYLEQINENADFRDLAEFFSATTYLHLVPQLLKFSDEISGRIVENDPFGQGLLQRIARAPEKTRDARLSRIGKALQVAVPQFSELRFIKNDEVTGMPHLEANFQHWRVNGAWQREEQFSDGTLRLIGLLWALQEGDGLLLIEEPELSLNDAIVEHIPLMVDRVLRLRKKGIRQVMMTTHSKNLIAAVSDSNSVVLLELGENGTTARGANAAEKRALAHGLNPAEVLLPKTRPQRVEQMGLF
ncbi:MAG: AAA family ATPase [Methylobacillus sp.]|jgi:predicted ATPase|nr:AAA family ATPase [Methylobacillus sp.]